VVGENTQSLGRIDWVLSPKSTAALATYHALVDMKDRFYSWTALAFLATALLGFGRSYHAKSVAQPELLTPLVRLHAALFMTWLVLLVVQTALVARHRAAWHRRLGIFGALLGVSLLPVGWSTALSITQKTPASARLLMFQAGALALFGVFVGLALYYRRRPEAHRRLMLLATVAIIPPAIARLPLVGARPVLAVALSLLFVVAGLVHDYATRGRLHSAYVWGGLLLLLSLPARFVLGQTSAWQAIAGRLVE
jgi:hypothetical protein